MVPSTRAVGPVAQLEDVRHRVLRDAPHAMGQEIHQRDARPRARRLPQRWEPGAIAEAGAAEETAGADPRREQREDQHMSRQRAAGHEEVVTGLQLA